MKRPAPAKINLSLKISGLRPDGFHEIETLMAPVSLCDEVTVELSESSGITLTCSDSTLPCDSSNLGWKAAEAFFETIGRRESISIHIEKKIPSGAGLGGGSSDAATVILLLNDLLKTKLPFEALEKIAARTGSDTAFFIRGKAAICRGRGEIIEPYLKNIDLPLLLIKPPFGVETAWAYKKWKEAYSGKISERQEVSEVIFENDLERPVFGKHLFLAALKQWLLEQSEVDVALLSGSGSVVYAVISDPAAGAALSQKVKAEFGDTMWICETRALSQTTG